MKVGDNVVRLLPVGDMVDFCLSLWKFGLGVKVIIGGPKEYAKKFNAVGPREALWEMESRLDRKDRWMHRMEAHMIHEEQKKKLLSWPHPQADRGDHADAV